jgi:hypothetical protein
MAHCKAEFLIATITSTAKWLSWLCVLHTKKKARGTQVQNPMGFVFKTYWISELCYLFH